MCWKLGKHSRGRVVLIVRCHGPHEHAYLACISLAVRLTLCLTLCPHTLCFASQACHPRYCSLLTILDVLFLFTWCPATSTPLSLHLQATIGHSRNELNSTSKSITEGLWQRSGWRNSGGVLRQIRMRLGQHSLEAEFGMPRKY